MAGIFTALLVSGVAHGVDKIKAKRKAKQRADSGTFDVAAVADEGSADGRARAEKQRLAAHLEQQEQDQVINNDNDAAGEESSRGRAVHPTLRIPGEGAAPGYDRPSFELPSYAEAAGHGTQEAPVLPPYDAPMSPNTLREFESYLNTRCAPVAGPAARERSPGAPKGETDEERRKRKIEEFWKLRGGGWWSFMGWSLGRGVWGC